MRRPPQSEVDQFQNSWSKRLSAAQSEGIPDNVIRTVYNMDANRLLKGDSYYSNEEAMTAMKALHAGRPVMAPGQNAPSVGEDIKSLPSNIYSDTRNLVTGIIHTPSDLWQHELYPFVADIEGGNGSNADKLLGDPSLYKDKSTTGKAAAALNSPIVNLIPGATDLASILSGNAGQLLEHPISSILDVAPALGKLAGLASTSERVANAAEVANAAKPAEVANPIEALKANIAKTNFTQKISKAIVDTKASHIGKRGPQEIRGDMPWNQIARWNQKYPALSPFKVASKTVGQTPLLGRTIAQWVEGGETRLGVAPFQRELYRATAEANRTVRTEAHNFTNSLLGAKVNGIKYSDLSPSERNSIYKYITNPSTAPKLTNRAKAFIPVAEHAAATIKQKMMSQGKVKEITFPDGSSHVFSSESPIMQKISNWEKSMQKIDPEFRYDPATDTLPIDPRGVTPPSEILPSSAYDLLNSLDSATAHDFLSNIHNPDIHPTTANVFASSAQRRALASHANYFFGTSSPFNRLKSQIYGDVRTTTANGKPLSKSAIARNYNRQIQLALKTAKEISSKINRSKLLSSHPVFQQMKAFSDELQRQLQEGLATNKLSSEVIKNPAPTFSEMHTAMVRSQLISKATEGRNLTARQQEAIAEIKSGSNKQIPYLESEKLEDTIAPGYSAIDHVLRGLYLNRMDVVTSALTLDGEPLITASQLTQISSDVKKSWVELTQTTGEAPQWLPKIAAREAKRLPNPSIFIDRNQVEKLVKNRAFNLSSSYADAMVSLSHAQAQILITEFGKAFLDNNITPFLMSHSDVIKSIGIDMSKRPAVMAPDEFINHEISNHFVEFNPDAYFPTATPRPSVFTTGQKVYIHKSLARTLESMKKSWYSPETSGFMGAYNRGMRVYRGSLVRLSPRYLLGHLAQGGLTLMAMRTSPSLFIKQFPKYLEMTRKGISFPNAIEQEVPEIVTFDGAWQHSVGRTLGDYLSQEKGWDKLANASDKIAAKYEYLTGLEKKLNHMYRAVTYLYGLDRYGSEKMAIDLVHKVYADLDTLSPLERSIIKNVVPFYAWEKHIIRYILTYPSDHPYRAAILAHSANQQLADYKSGIPQRFSLLFFLGSANAMGDQLVLDDRQLNPFRSAASYLTLGGFLQSLNPVIEGALSASGINPATGKADSLYPQLSYDSFYGSQSQVPTTSFWGAEIEQIVPETQAFDLALGLSHNARSLKGSKTPYSYEKAIFSALNLPMWMPQKTNLNELKAQTQVNLYANAAQNVKDFLKTGNQQLIQGWSYMPYNGYLVTPKYLTKLYNSAKAAYPSLPPSVSITPPPAPRFPY